MSNPIILITDDDTAVLNAVERDLRRKYGRDYRITKTDSGAKALEFLGELQKRNEIIALFLTDQRMPSMTGIEFLEKARNFSGSKKGPSNRLCRYRSGHKLN
jgi:thioredoxin reductase (NADPH)